MVIEWRQKKKSFIFSRAWSLCVSDGSFSQTNWWNTGEVTLRAALEMKFMCVHWVRHRRASCELQYVVNAKNMQNSDFISSLFAVYIQTLVHIMIWLSLQYSPTFDLFIQNLTNSMTESGLHNFFCFSCFSCFFNVMIIRMTNKLFRRLVQQLPHMLLLHFLDSWVLSPDTSSLIGACSESMHHTIMLDDDWSCIRLSRTLWQTSCCFATATGCQWIVFFYLFRVSLCSVWESESGVKGWNKSQWKRKSVRAGGKQKHHVRRLNFTAQPLTTFTHFSSNCR